MKKILLMFSTVLMLTVCLCVPSFAFDDISTGCPVSSDGKHAVSYILCSVYTDGRVFYKCHRCMETDDSYVKNISYPSYEFYRAVMDSILEHGVVWIDDVRYDRACDCDCKPWDFEIASFSGIHKIVCAHCLTPLPDRVQSVYFSVESNVDCIGKSCPVCSEFSCSAMTTYFSGEDEELFLISSLVLYEDENAHYLVCTDCGACFVSCKSEWYTDSGDEFPSLADCEDCSGDYLAYGYENRGQLPADFFPSGSDSVSILPDVTSGVTSAASWVSTFANTIMSTPILLISAILAFIGFGIGIFKRLRT